MITPLEISVDLDLINRAIAVLPSIDFKLALNTPTGDFFYDPWKIKPEFKDTLWDNILATLPASVGEARLIKLPIKECYVCHADMDNRYHLPLVGKKSFLVDLTVNKMHSLDTGKWYYMDAGLLHSAVNFGDTERIQLVVRELLKSSKLLKPKHVTISPAIELHNLRYLFDSFYSPLLNKWNYNGLTNNFKVIDSTVVFDIESHIEIPKHESFIISTVNKF